MDEEEYDDEQDGKAEEYGDEEGNQEEYGDQEDQSYYDENGNEVAAGEGDQQYYGDEGGEGESNLWTRDWKPTVFPSVNYNTI